MMGLAAALGAAWWMVFGLKPYALTPEALQARYEVSVPAAAESAVSPPSSAALRPGPDRLQWTPVPVPWPGAVAFDLTLKSFDGETAVGRIVYPSDPAAPPAGRPWPVMVALHGLGRTHMRWWQHELRGRPTLENTHRVTALALQQGFVVVALDARGHGVRKGDGPLPSQLLENLHLWGQREPYERMIIDTVRDYRMLLDVLARRPELNTNSVAAAGYSMGGQMALLLAGVDARVGAVAALVPPHLDQRTAAVAPLNVVGRLQGRRVWLVTADSDEYASAKDNATLFAALPADPRNRHIRLPGGHLLPADYVDQLTPWLQATAAELRTLPQGPAPQTAMSGVAAPSP